MSDCLAVHVSGVQLLKILLFRSNLLKKILAGQAYLNPDGSVYRHAVGAPLPTFVQQHTVAAPQPVAPTPASPQTPYYAAPPMAPPPQSQEQPAVQRQFSSVINK